MEKDEGWLLDIVRAARKIQQYAEGIDRQAFTDDEMRRDAIIRQITIIGEAASQLSDHARGLTSEIPWKQIVGTRHILIHRYWRTEVERIWEIVESHIDPLIAAVSPLIPADPEQFDEVPE